MDMTSWQVGLLFQIQEHARRIAKCKSTVLWRRNSPPRSKLLVGSYLGFCHRLDAIFNVIFNISCIFNFIFTDGLFEDTLLNLICVTRLPAEAIGVQSVQGTQDLYLVRFPFFGDNIRSPGPLQSGDSTSRITFYLAKCMQRGFDCPANALYVTLIITACIVIRRVVCFDQRC